jgi:vitamin B12 transporter
LEETDLNAATLEQLLYRSLSAAAFFFFAVSLTAQNQPGVSGQVKDTQARGVPDAQLRLFRQDLSEPVITFSDARGDFRFEGIEPGAVVLEVQKDGFRSQAINLQVDKHSRKALDVTLDVAGVNETVIVTAAGEAQTADEVSKAYSNISHDEIVNRDEYSIANLLATVPGVQIFNQGGPGQYTTMSIRGLPTSAGAILVDGLRFRDAATTQADATSFLSTLNVNDVDHIEVMRGSGSSLYGTNAIGGTVNILTDQGGGATHGQVQLEGGSLGLIRGRAMIAGGALRDKLKYSLGLAYLNVMSGVGGQNTYRSAGIQGSARYDFSSKMSLSGRFWGSDDFAILDSSPTNYGIPYSNIPASIIVPAIPLSPAGVKILLAGGTPNFGNATYIPDADDPGSQAGSRFENTALIFRDIVSPVFDWQASYQLVHTGRTYNDGPGGIGYQPPADDFSQYAGTINTAGMRATARITPWLSLTGGYEYERENYFDRQNNNLPAPDLITEQTHAHQQSNAGYFAAQFAFLHRRLQVSLSGRAQAFDLSSPDFQYNGTGNPYTNLSLNVPHALTGDVSIAYLLPKSSTKLRAHAGNAYRAPALYERFGGGFYNNPANGSVVFTPYGDPRLAPDRYNSVDAGLDQYFFRNKVRLSATAFYIRIAQRIEFDSSGIVNPSTDPFGRGEGYINGAGGISRGEEVSVEARPASSLTFSAAYTYTNADTDQDSEVPGFYRTFDSPRHMVTMVATKQWSKRFLTTISLFHYSNYFDAFVGYLQAYEFPGYTKANFTASYRAWEREKKSARIYAKVDNLFHETYYVAGFLAPRTTFVTGIGYSF